MKGQPLRLAETHVAAVLRPLRVVAITLVALCLRVNAEPCIEPAVDLDLQAVYYSNLDGNGPSANKPKAIRYGKVVQIGNTMVDLLIQAQGPYKPINVNHNFNSGKCREIGNINVASGHPVNLTFTFVRHRRDEPVTVPQFHLTFFLVDARESVTVSNFDSFCVSNDTVLEVTDRSPGNTRFAVAGSDLGGRLHVSNPNSLASQERIRAVTFRFRNTALVPVKLEVSGGTEDGGADFSFAGTSPLERSHHAVCWASAGDIGDATLGMAGTTSTATASTSTFTSMSTTTVTFQHTSATTTTILMPANTSALTMTTVSVNMPDAEGPTTLSTTMVTTVSSTTMATDWFHDDVFQCNSGFPEGWNPGKKFWCCKYHNQGCDGTTNFVVEPLVPYDCSMDTEFGASRWSMDQRAWCCRTQARGCLTTVQPTQQQPNMWTTMSTTFVLPRTLSTTTASLQMHHCLNMEELSSEETKAVCCQRFGQGCSTSGTPQAVANKVHVHIEMTKFGSLLLDEVQAFTANCTEIKAISARSGSIHGSSVASNCIDGLYNTSCETSRNTDLNWLDVEYPGCPEVTAITLWSRDNGVRSSIEGALVRITEERNEVKPVWKGTLVGVHHKYHFTNFNGKLVFLLIEMKSTEALNVDEVEAFGADGASLDAVWAKMGSTQGLFVAARCIDGLATTGCQSEAALGKNWLLVAFADKPDIASIRVSCGNDDLKHNMDGATIKLASDQEGTDPIWTSALVGVHKQYHFNDVTRGLVFVRIDTSHPEPINIHEVEAFSKDGKQISAVSAEMGSVDGSLLPSRCIDGFQTTACQTTGTAGKNWLLVAYPMKPPISSITVSSHDSGPTSRMEGAMIKLTTDRAGVNVVWSKPMVGVHGKYYFTDISRTFVYVRVDMTRSGELSMREVKASAADGTTIPAIRAEMGSTIPPAVAARCIDGLMATYCRTTSTFGRNWLMVAFPSTPEIASVTLRRYEDGAEGPDGATVKLSMDKAGRKVVWSDVLLGSQQEYRFTGLARRKVYLRLEKPRAGALIMNEVEAFRADGTQIPTLSAELGSTHESLVASRCIDGLDTTQCQTSPGIGQNWFSVAYPADAPINSIKVRSLGKAAQDSTASTIIKVATDATGFNAVWSNTLDGTHTEYHFKNISLQLVHVRVDMANLEALSLNEVEAYGNNHVKVHPFSAQMGSTDGAAIALRCIDGLETTSCRTKRSLGQNWLLVSYPAFPEIISLKLSASKSYEENHLDGASLKLSTDPEGRHPVWFSAIVGTHQEYTFNDMIKRLVFLRIDMAKAVPISMSEVQAFDEQSKQLTAYYAKQGSTSGTHIASRCIDGSVITSSRTTGAIGKNWLLVAYPTQPGIASIRLLSHEAITAQGLDGATVKLVTDEAGRNTMWSSSLRGGHDAYAFPKISKHLVYVRIDMAGAESLSLDEVAAFAEDGIKLMPISAKMGSAYGSWDASRCIDGLVTTVCRTKAGSADHWLLVVYPAEPDIFSIVLTSHAAGKENRIAGATIKLSTDEAGLNQLWSSKLSGVQTVYRFTNVVAKQVSTSKPYDCLAGSSKWKALWPLAKQEWCCQRFSVGCSHSQAETTIEPYDCHVGSAAWQILWSDRRKQWCCTRYLRGCEVDATTAAPTKPFDCQAGLSNWRAGWSQRKQQWCCKHYQLGCSQPITEPFDCEAGLVNWKRGWSREKQDWCCRTYQKGCRVDLSFAPQEASVEPIQVETVDVEPESGQECFSGPSEQWTCSKRHRCCTQHYQGCELAWCCHHEGIGCKGPSMVSMQAVTDSQQTVGSSLRWSQVGSMPNSGTSATWNQAVRKFQMLPQQIPSLDVFLLPTLLGAIGLAAAVLLAMHTWSGSRRPQSFPNLTWSRSRMQEHPLGVYCLNGSAPLEQPYSLVCAEELE